MRHPTYKSLLARLAILTFLICMLVTAFSADFSLPRSSPPALFRRSLPGSLATAPKGAVGYYQPPPGPVNEDEDPVPLTRTHISPTHEAAHELRGVASATGEAESGNNPTKTQSVVEATSSGIASKKAVLGGGLGLTILLSSLHL
ncbi:hypothetical protein ASPZODRAFT_18215 [Penicilliopsis zonata CBS 506.65]|uniref:Uncharacterized protein n=1 Tax=Penicilliopsis zonata CBS 506.65 TaxID=1073090 RepID=A0A1L9SBQ7_9EURO|nr:hypothetical protein ASPZODRAFT_18215 [Penicilliopsis zonata CBS 506.65]OJJ44640.1 hypothetical protein ASPZODRAFT_18215 [Penicilliopsis zonata CBS 506.65]